LRPDWETCRGAPGTKRLSYPVRLTTSRLRSRPAALRWVAPGGMLRGTGPLVESVAGASCSGSWSRRSSTSQGGRDVGHPARCRGGFGRLYVAWRLRRQRAHGAGRPASSASGGCSGVLRWPGPGAPALLGRSYPDLLTPTRRRGVRGHLNDIIHRRCGNCTRVRRPRLRDGGPRREGSFSLCLAASLCASRRSRRGRSRLLRRSGQHLQTACMHPATAAASARGLRPRRPGRPQGNRRAGGL